MIGSGEPVGKYDKAEGSSDDDGDLLCDEHAGPNGL